MKRFSYLLLLLLLFGCSVEEVEVKPLKLWYDEPAEEWNEALPIGNGRLGAMVYGGTGKEVITLNEETLWSGYPHDGNNSEASKFLPLVRKAFAAGDYLKANQLTTKMQGAFSQSYAPMGTLTLDFEGDDSIHGYYRDLNLNNAVATIHYQRGNTKYTREIFASYPDQLIVVRLVSDTKSKLSFKISLDSKLKHTIKTDEGNQLVLTGKCPKHADPDYLGATESPVIYDDFEGEGINFSTRLQIRNKGGAVHSEKDYLQVQGADEVILFVSAGSSFNGFDKSPGYDGRSPDAIAKKHLLNVEGKPYAAILNEHIRDYQSYFNRVELALTENIPDTIPTNKRLLNYDTEHPDLHLDELLFQYGRYLLISSSRPGGTPANLQGIWSHKVRPPWSDNYTTNINVEMNYWLAEVTNLSEMHEPLLRFIDDLSVNGEKTAQTYGMAGWCAHHNTDIWALTNPVGGYGSRGLGSVTWANFPFAGVWLCQHLFEHYRFTNDIVFLREKAYPLMKGAAMFLNSWLYEGPDGTLVSAPSVSPENYFKYNNKGLAGQLASTIDMTLARELYSHCIETAMMLEVDQGLIETWKNKRDKLTPFKVGQHGQLQEWYYDWDSPEDQHRHLSHLYGLYPGNQISPLTTPELSEACKKVLEFKGDGGTGWSLAWKVNLWARLLDGNRAHQLISNIYNYVNPSNYDRGNVGGGSYPNLLGACPPFMIDGNFGVTAGIAEMLIQSHMDGIHLLPALPGAWASGEVKGLCARDGFEVDMKWDIGELVSVNILSKLGNTCKLRLNDKIIEFETSKGNAYSFNTMLEMQNP